MEQDQGQNTDQHHRRAEHGEQEELGGSVGPATVTPPGDEKVHGYQHDLEEHEEGEEIESAEHAQAAGLQHQQPGVIRLGGVLGFDPHDGQGEQQGGEHHQEQRDAVHAEMPGYAEVFEPAVAFDELEPSRGRAGGEVGQHPHCHRCGGGRHQGGHQLGQLRARPG